MMADMDYLINILYICTPLGFLLVVNSIPDIVSKTKTLFDIVTEGKHNKNKASLDYVLLSLVNDPDEWLIRKDYARFPKTGNMSKICLEKNTNKQLTIAVQDVNNGKETVIDGFYKHSLLSEIEYNYQRVSRNKVVEYVYPDKLENLKLLENYK